MCKIEADGLNCLMVRPANNNWEKFSISMLREINIQIPHDNKSITSCIVDTL